MKPASELTDEQLNIAICEWLGWKFHEAPVSDPSPCCWSDPQGRYPTFTEDLPNHVTGHGALDNLHEAEKKLTPQQKIQYMELLCERYMSTHWQIYLPAVLAGPRQKSEALYTVINQGDSK